MMKRCCHGQSGFVLLLVLVVVAAAAILGVSYLSGASMHMIGSTNLASAARARYLAESGLEHSLYVLQTDPGLLQSSTEAGQLGPFYVDGSDDRYTFYAAPGAGTDDIYTIIATGFSKGMKQSAYWRLGESSGAVAQDTTGAHNAVYVNGVTLSQGGALIGTNDTAAHFDGVNDYTDTQIWDVDAAAMTLMAWFNADEFDTRTDPRILCKGKNVGDDQYWTLRTIAVDGAVRLEFTLWAGARRELAATSGDIQPGQWVFAVAVYDGQNMILYRDGVEVGRRAQTGMVRKKDDAPVWIGGNPPDPLARPWHGLLDEVAVFDRGLTAEQVVELYAARRPRPVIVQWHD